MIISDAFNKLKSLDMKAKFILFINNNDICKILNQLPQSLMTWRTLQHHKHGKYIKYIHTWEVSQLVYVYLYMAGATYRFEWPT